MSARPLILAVSLVLGADAAVAARSPCDDRRLPEGPVPVGFTQADFGVVRSACPRAEIGISVDGRAIVESESFYGNIRAASRLDVSATPIPQLELFFNIEPLTYQLVIQSFRAEHIGLGDASIGGTLLAFGRERFALSVTSRFTAPTALGLYRNAWPAALEAGMLLLVAPTDEIRLHGGLLAGARFAFTKAASDDRGAVIANAGGDFVLDDWVALTVDLDAQALERGALDHISVGAALRFVIADELALEIGAVVPLAGDERNLAAAVARTAYRFE